MRGVIPAGFATRIDHRNPPWNFQYTNALPNPTDDLWEKVLKAPLIECMYSVLDVLDPTELLWHHPSFVPSLLSGLKTSVCLSFENPQDNHL